MARVCAPNIVQWGAYVDLSASAVRRGLFSFPTNERTSEGRSTFEGRTARTAPQCKVVAGRPRAFACYSARPAPDCMLAAVRRRLHECCYKTLCTLLSMHIVGPTFYVGGCVRVACKTCWLAAKHHRGGPTSSSLPT